MPVDEGIFYPLCLFCLCSDAVGAEAFTKLLHTGSSRTKAYLGVVDRVIMWVIIYSFNLNISPKISHGVLECDILMLELHAYDFVIKKGCYLC